jgi:2-isopropylmalate synthase
MIEILDTTLREGEQTPNVSFTTFQKIEIAKLLDEFGVDFIEAGHPAISEKIENDVKAICKLKLKAEIVGHARATKEDIDKVFNCGCKWVGIFMGINDLSLRYKYHLTNQEAQNKFLDALRYAKQKGLKVRCSIEDGSRTDIEDWISFAKEVEKIGIDRFSVIDTVGAMTPRKIYDMVNAIKKEIKTDLNIHCHNDFGMAVANSLTAYEAGAKCLDVTVNGLGERAGIASLSTVTAALSVLYGIKKWNLKLLPKISKLVEKYSRIRVPVRQPVIGKNVFTHKGGLHSTAVLENPDVYEILHPEAVGNKRSIILGKFTSKKVLEEYLRKVNKNISQKEIDKTFKRIKSYKK